MRTLIFLAVSSLAVSENTLAGNELPIRLIPLPQNIVHDIGVLRLDGSVDIRVGDTSLAFSAREVRAALTARADLQIQRSADIVVDLRIDSDLAADHYSLQIDGEGVVVAAGSEVSAFYAVQTLRQILFQAPLRDGSIELPVLRIDDYPRLAYRGMHLDVSRHFFDLDFVKRYIDLLALHKMNFFHWHLTDDQGWRIEIKAHPKLTDVGSRRSGTVRGHTLDANAGSDEQEYGGYYTQEQVREVVTYAAERHITIVPEIDVPGHASAILASYPGLGCTGNPTAVQTHFGVFNQTLCPRESTFEFLQQVLAEVAALFPGPYIHIGADEVKKDQWQACPDCKSLMAEHGLVNQQELQAWFVNRVEKIVNTLGKRIIGWDEILDGEVNKSATVMSWRGMRGGIQGAKRGHDVIMTPLNHVYFDFYQSESLDEPMAIHGLTRLPDVYRFQPVPQDLSPEQQARIIGGQGNLWTEYIADEASAERMILPRMSALAEVLWTAPEKHSFADFALRLPDMERLLDTLGYTVADSHYKPHIVVKEIAGGSFQVSLDSLSKKMVYTVDGSRPEINSIVYHQPFVVSASTTVRAASLTARGELLGDARMSLVQHKARGQNVSLSAPGPPMPSPDSLARLVDGRVGHDRIFRYHDWVRFDSGMDVILNLSRTEAVSQVSIGVDAGLHRKLHKPTSFSVMARDLQGEWSQLSEINAEGIAAAGSVLSLRFEPRKLSQLRLVLTNEKQIWSAEKQAYVSAPSWVDEIIVH